MRLTKRLCDAATYEGDGRSRCIVWDDEVKGLGLRVYPSGRKSFAIVYRANGRQRLMTLGPYGVLTVKQARDRARARLLEVLDGEDPLAARRERSADLTVAQLGERYMDDHARRHKKPRSVAADDRMWTKSIVPAIGTLRVSAVTPADVRRLHAAVGAEAPVKANRLLALLSKAFNLAEQWGMRPLRSNPCLHVAKFKEKPRERFLSTSELRRLGDALATVEAKRTIGPAAALAIRLILLTGCRKSEILSLRWEHVDFDRSMIHLPDSKTGQKSVYLSPAVVELLRGTPRTSGSAWVIEGHQRGRHLVNMDKPWRRVREAAGLDDVRIHDLRHTYGGEAAGAGLSLHIVGRLLGHKQAATTQRYAHLADDPMRDAAAEVGGRISAAMDGRGVRAVEGEGGRSDA
jgi:integrase